VLVREQEIVAVADGELEIVAVLVADGVGGGVNVYEALKLTDFVTVVVNEPEMLPLPVDV
jgi:2-keto-4-pentenoate hydratase